MLVSMSRFETPHRFQKLWLAVECGLLFVGVPVAYAVGWLPVTIIPLLLLMAGGCGLVLHWRYKTAMRDLLRTRVPGLEWRRIVIIYAVAIPCLIWLLWAMKPAALFSLICRHPAIWLLVMFAYPVISVLPQELIYRAFFFERYRPLFGRSVGMVAANAVTFSIGHVLFHNWPAVILTLFGGCLFARTYQRTSSLLLVSVEHALYGCAVFTIGYGEFFFEGTLRLFRQ
jgi:membrane protease YdiL (CAAX protease family)